MDMVYKDDNSVACGTTKYRISYTTEPVLSGTVVLHLLAPCANANVSANKVSANDWAGLGEAELEAVGGLGRQRGHFQCKARLLILICLIARLPFDCQTISLVLVP